MLKHGITLGLTFLVSTLSLIKLHPEKITQLVLKVDEWIQLFYQGFANQREL